MRRFSTERVRVIETPYSAWEADINVIRITETVTRTMRTGNHFILWIALHNLVTLLDETGHHHVALELWAELRDRAGWIYPEHRSDLQTRFGPPGQPHLNDDELLKHSKEILRQLA